MKVTFATFGLAAVLVRPSAPLPLLHASEHACMHACMLRYSAEHMLRSAVHSVCCEAHCKQSAMQHTSALARCPCQMPTQAATGRCTCTNMHGDGALRQPLPFKLNDLSAAASRGRS